MRLTDGQRARIGAVIGERLGLEALTAFEAELRELRAIAEQSSKTIERMHFEEIAKLRKLLAAYFAYAKDAK